MTINEFIFKIKQKIIFFLGRIFFQYPRIYKYKFLSTCASIGGKPYLNTAVLFAGQGKIKFGKDVVLGVGTSPLFYNTYGYIEVRGKEAKVNIGNNVIINNNFKLISHHSGIEIGDSTLIGFNLEIIDSDFHELDPEKRIGGIPKMGKVVIGSNVFIGNNVKILKNVTIGNNSVIANSSVVIKSIPANVIAGGYPAKVLKEIDVN